MNPVIGPLSYQDPNGQESFQKPFSEDTGKMIDSEVRKLVNQAFDRTHKLLTDKKADVEKVAQLLLTKEVISREDMENLLGKRPFKEKTVYDEYVRPKPVSVVIKCVCPAANYNSLTSLTYYHQSSAPPPFPEDAPEPPVSPDVK
jgi:AFG3 family protein